MTSALTAASSSMNGLRLRSGTEKRIIRFRGNTTVWCAPWMLTQRNERQLGRLTLFDVRSVKMYQTTVMYGKHIVIFVDVSEESE